MRQISNFRETKEKMMITFGGWDGKSYDGEGRKMNVWVNDCFPDKKFVCLWTPCFGVYTIHEITEKKHEISGYNRVSYFNNFDRERMIK